MARSLFSPTYDADGVNRKHNIVNACFLMSLLIISNMINHLLLMLIYVFKSIFHRFFLIFILERIKFAISLNQRVAISTFPKIRRVSDPVNFHLTELPFQLGDGEESVSGL